MAAEKIESINFKEEFFKYLRFWPWFLVSVVLCVGAGFFYVRYTPEVYSSSAKIRILDEDQEMEIPLTESALLGGNKLNLENEIQTLKSNEVLAGVVRELHLDISYYYEASLKNTLLWEAPFVIAKDSSAAAFGTALKVALRKQYIAVQQAGSEKWVQVPYSLEPQAVEGLPITIQVKDLELAHSGNYLVHISSQEQALLGLKSALMVSALSKDSEILTLGISGENKEKNEAILQTVITHFNEDGVRDRQLVSERTINFIDERFKSLKSELDSIEIGKKDYKQGSGISFIEGDAGAVLTNKEELKGRILEAETQISLAKLLQESLDQEDAYTLLPANVGLSSVNVSTLVERYNELVMTRNVAMAGGAGAENPNVLAANSELASLQGNIAKSLQVYQQQLRTQLRELEKQAQVVSGAFGAIPDQELALRAINRQQGIKESLYLLLLQKREEAAIKYAVTSPSVKVLDTPYTSWIPVAPKKNIIYLACFLLGMFIPFGVLFLVFMSDNKIHGKADLEKIVSEVPVLAELPFVEGQEILNAGDSRSTLAEAFRILSTNVEYLLPEPKPGKGRVVFVTSTRKGEGKTFVALNLSLALASLDKKVLLVGSDLRNPQLHRYFNQDKNFSRGLSGYLFDKNMAFEECLEEGFTDFPTHKICFSGIIPPNAPQLLASQRYADFLAEAREHFDYVIMDTAPTILVTDTLMISKYADETVYVTRANYTEKEILNFAQELYEDKKLNNMAFVVNAVGKSSKKYGYGYKYGYSYGYGYNYGYGYGYGSDEEETPKKKGLFAKNKK